MQQEVVGEEKNTHVRHVGVPVMGLDLLAEMKARQEKMAVKKVRRVHMCPHLRTTQRTGTRLNL